MDFCRKVYIHSGHRTRESASSSDFRITLKRNVALPKRCAAYVSDICLPHSWYSIDSHCRRILFNFEAYNVTNWRLVELAEGNSTGIELIDHIATTMDLLTRPTDRHVLTEYDADTGKMLVQMLPPLSGSWQYNVGGQASGGEHFVANSGLFSWNISGPVFATTLLYAKGFLQDTNGALVTFSGSKLFFPGGAELHFGHYDAYGIFMPSDLPDSMFRIFTDHEIRHSSEVHSGLENALPPIRLDYNAPATINEILRHSGESGNADRKGGTVGPFISGFLDLLCSSTPLYITSPELTNFDSSQGPMGESSIIRRVANSASFGQMIHDRGFYELDYFVCASSSIMTISFRLQQQNGHTVNLHGAEWSFSLIFQELPG